jgi:glutathione synthase/RimK-type ligase-like ATP-grasp enzyme
VNGEYYVSKFYQKSREFRAIVIQGRVAVIIEKTPNNRSLPAWGRAAGWTRVRWGQWNIDMVKKAILAHNHTGLDISAVDVILDNNGDYYVCEVNSAPEMGDGEQQRVAWCLDYIVESGKAPIAIGGDGSNWKHYIHPAISGEAIV